MNKFAIILPTIGRETLKAAIESVLAQSYQEWNLVISWDWDEAYKVLLTGGWMSNDCRIINISRDGSKPSNDSGAAARNYAMQFVPTDCDWICYLDDDDIWHSNRLWRFKQFIEEHDERQEPLDLFYSHADLYKMKHKSPRSSEMRLKRIGVIDNVTCGGMCHKPWLFEHTNGWNPKNTEDHDRELFEEMKKFGYHDVLPESTFDFIWR